MSFSSNYRRCSPIVKVAPSALVFLGFTLACVSQSFAIDNQEESKPAAKSTGQSDKALDEALLKGLSNDLLEGIDDLPKLKPDVKPSATKKPADTTTPREGTPAEPRQPLIDTGDDLGQTAEDRNPLAQIARHMREVQRRISNSQAGEDTQKKQQTISEELAKLIEQLKKTDQTSQKPGGGHSPSSQRSKVAQAGQNAAGQRQSDKPARESSNRTQRGEVARPDPAAIRQQMKEAWGNLPQRIREQMMQSSVEEFLPKYELLIEKYFQRLSEDEKPEP